MKPFFVIFSLLSVSTVYASEKEIIVESKGEQLTLKSLPRPSDNAQFKQQEERFDAQKLIKESLASPEFLMGKQFSTQPAGTNAVRFDSQEKL